MDWKRDYDLLSELDKEWFAKVMSRLFDETFLLRDVWDIKEGRLVGNRDYRFIERVRPILEEYLQVSGWALQVDSLRGVIAIYNRFGRNRRQLDKLTTYVLFILRLMYDEQMEEVSMRREIVIALRDVYDKLHALGFVDKKLAQYRLQATLMQLRKLSVIERIDGDGVQPDSRWIVYPTIRLLVPEDKINQVYEELEENRMTAAEYEDTHGEDYDLEEDALAAGLEEESQ